MLPGMRTLYCALLICLLSACRPVASGVTPYPSTEPTSVSSWDDVLAHPSEVEASFVLSARWSVPRKGLINLKNPTAKEAGITNGDEPIVILVGIIRHPEYGDFIVDTGIDATLAAGKSDYIHGGAAAFIKTIEPVRSLKQIIEEEDLDLHGVLLTHAHLDHVMGLPDVPDDVPLILGPGEPGDKSMQYFLAKGSYKDLFEGKTVQELDESTGIELDPTPVAFDLLGDGSLWAIYSPGHTAGSLAFLANAADGPVLFTGDTSHTVWGWEHGVEPGTFTADHEANRRSLKRLKKLAEDHDMMVVLGHQLFEGQEPAEETAGSTGTD